MSYIFVLKLKTGKFYIGKTTQPHFRFTDYSPETLEWTTTYKPIGMDNYVMITPERVDEMVDVYTKKYMVKYGIARVRGGSFSSFEIDDSTFQDLIQETRGQIISCNICGSKSHLMGTNCPMYFKDGYQCIVYNWCCKHCASDFSDIKQCVSHEEICLFRS